MRSKAYSALNYCPLVTSLLDGYFPAAALAMLMCAPSARMPSSSRVKLTAEHFTAASAEMPNAIRANETQILRCRADVIQYFAKKGPCPNHMLNLSRYLFIVNVAFLNLKIQWHLFIYNLLIKFYRTVVANRRSYDMESRSFH